MSTSADTKRAALDRALEHIRAGAQDRLRYAALDLRLCLETMTLEKLRLYRRYLPASFSTETWQPYKQLRAMVQIDSIADQSFVLLAGPESVPGVDPPPESYRPIGEHRAFSKEWLTKAYNKLGSMVHLRADLGSAADVAFLADVASRIEHALGGSITGMRMVRTITFECETCGSVIPVSETFARGGNVVACLSDGCPAEYDPEVDGLGPPRFTRRPAAATCAFCGRSG